MSLTFFEKSWILFSIPIIIFSVFVFSVASHILFFQFNSETGSVHEIIQYNWLPIWIDYVIGIAVTALIIIILVTLKRTCLYFLCCCYCDCCRKKDENIV